MAPVTPGLRSGLPPSADPSDVIELERPNGARS
jgi:hypothetical protein